MTYSTVGHQHCEEFTSRGRRDLQDIAAAVISSDETEQRIFFDFSTQKGLLSDTLTRVLHAAGFFYGTIGE